MIRQLLRRYPVEHPETLLVNGMAIDEIEKESMRELVSYVPQEHQLFARSVEANIMLDLAFLDNGLETIVGEYGVTLSGGQKQRLSIARALMKDAPILILDDSLSAVDGTTEANIIANLKQIRNKKTNIIVAHRLTAVEACDEIIVMEDGKIIERGTHETLMRQKGWYYEQYVIQEMGGEAHAKMEA